MQGVERECISIILHLENRGTVHREKRSKKGIWINPVHFLFHRNRVIYIPDTREGYRCNGRVDIIKRICLDLF